MRTDPFTVFALAFWLAACGHADDGSPAGVRGAPTHPISGCEDIDHRSCDVRDTPCQERLLELAACIRGEETPPMPPVTVMTETEFSDYLYSTVEDEQVEPEVNHLERALVNLGLVEPNALALDVVIADLVEEVGGVYRPELDDVIIVDHGQSVDRDMTSNVLVHEFVHYLQDLEVDLTQFSDAFSSTSDATLASISVFEGEAQLHQVRHYASLLGLNPNSVDYRERFEAMVDWSEQYLLQQPSPFTQVRGLFPYSWGGRYMQLAWADGGRQAVSERFAAPPRQTRTLMVESDGAIPQDVDATTFASPAPPDGWSLYAEDVGGAFMLFLYLTTLTTADEARSLSLAWRGDRLSIFAREDGNANSAFVNTVFAWRLALADATSRNRVFSLIGNSSVQLAPDGDTNMVLAGSYSSVALDWALAPLP